MKMKRTWKKVIARVLAAVMLVSIFSTVDMGWNVKKVHAAATYTMAELSVGKVLNGGDFIDNTATPTDYYLNIDGSQASYYSRDPKLLYQIPTGKAHARVMSMNEGMSSTEVRITTMGHSFNTKDKSIGFISGKTCTSGARYYYRCDYCSATGTNTYTDGDPAGHSFSYSGSGNMITAKCDNCAYTSTLTLTANNATYTGNTYTGATIGNWSKSDANLAGRPAAITYKQGSSVLTSVPIDVGDYTASITVSSGATAIKDFKITKKAPVASDFVCTPPSDLTYDKQDKMAAVVVKSGINGMGTISAIKYYNSSNQEVTPKEDGTYKVKITVAEGDNYQAVTDDNPLEVGTFTIIRGVYDGTKTESGTLKAIAGKKVDIVLPPLPVGATYGSITNSNSLFFTVEDVTDGKVTVTSVKNWDPDTDSESKIFTVRVDASETIYDDYDITVTITPEFHEHIFSYSVPENAPNTIEATCSNSDEDCFLTDYKATLKLITEDKDYTGLSYVGASIDSTEWESVKLPKLSIPSIKYAGRGNTTYGENETAPINAGAYTAKITVEDATAISDFSINKAAQDATAKVDGYTWGEPTNLPTPSCVNLKEEDKASPKYFYNEVDSTEGGKSWNDIKNKEYLDAGTYYIYATLEESDNYKSGTTATSSFTVQGLTIDTDIINTESPGGTDGVEYDKKPKTADIKVEGEGVNPEDYTITYATSPDGPFTEEKPTFTDAGEHKIYYRVKRFGYEVASGDVDVKINPKAITISNVKAKDKVYDGNTTASFDYSEVVYAGIIKGDTLSVTAKGTFSDKNVDENKTVTISTTDYELGGTSKNNYVLADSGHQNTAEANITQREVTLAWDSTSFEYDGNAKKPTATAGNVVSGDTCNVTAEVDGGNAINAGEYTARATPLDNPNYKLPSTVTQIFTINKIDQPTVTVTMDDFGYSDTSVPTPSVSGGAKENPSITYYYSLENKKTGGTEWKNVAPKSIEPDTYYMYAVLAETTNYNAYTTDPVQFIVNGSNMTGEVSVSDINANNEVIYTYTGKKEHGIKVNIPKDAKVMYGTTEGSYTLSECPKYKDVNAEGYTIYYKVTNTGYNPVKGSAKVVINKAPLTVTPDSGQTKVYGDVDPTFTYTVSGLLGSDTASVVTGTLKRDTGENVTSEGYELSKNDDMTADNYDITCTSGVKFMITPRDIAEAVIILTQKKFEYKSETIDVAANGNISVKYNGTNVSTDDYVISGNTGKEKNKYKVTISGKRNFSGSVEKDWSITEKIVPISNKEPKIEIVYGDEPTIITNLNGYNKDTDTITYGTSEDSVDEPTINLKNAGTYLIWYKVARDGFEPYEGFVTLIIEQKEVAIAWGDTSLVYNGKIQAPAATVKPESLVEGDICEVETSSDKKDVGSGYIATAIELTGENSSNYKLPSPLPTTEFKITPKSLTLKARNVSKYVGSKDPVLTYDAVGICSGDTLSGVSVARDPGESVGSYQIRVSVDPAVDNKNYTITMQSGVLVIKNHESNDEGSNGNSDGGSNGGGNSSGNTIPVVPVQKPVVLPIDALTANAANKNTKTTTGNNKGANLGADGTNAETDDLSGANGAGNLTLHLEVSEHSPIETASIETPVTKLLEGSDVFTTEEALAIKGGVDARVWVHIDKLDMSVVPDSVHDEILSAAKGLEDDNVELLYFDISLFKQIGDGEIINIHEPGTHIDITLELPESVINTDDKVVREYKILRLHDGVIDVIPTTYNPDTQTISFATDKFSTYVLAYIDKSAEEITEADNTDSITVNEVEKENSSTAIYIILFILLILAIAIIIFILYRRKKNEDTI